MFEAALLQRSNRHNFPCSRQQRSFYVVVDQNEFYTSGSATETTYCPFMPTCKQSSVMLIWRLQLLATKQIIDGVSCFGFTGSCRKPSVIALRRIDADSCATPPPWTAHVSSNVLRGSVCSPPPHSSPSLVADLVSMPQNQSTYSRCFAFTSAESARGSGRPNFVASKVGRLPSPAATSATSTRSSKAIVASF